MSASANRLMDSQSFTALLGSGGTTSDFDTYITLRGYRPARGGMSHYVIRAVPYRRVLRESLACSMALSPEQIAAECPAADGDVGLAASVLGKVRSSLTRSVEQGGVDKRYTLLAPGILRHRRTGALYVTGLVLRRQKVIHAFTKRSEPSREARVRLWIEARMPIGRWRQFKLDGDNWSELKLGEVVLRSSADSPDTHFDPYAYGFAKESAEERSYAASCAPPACR